MEHANWAIRFLIFLLCASILIRIWQARKGKKLFIRRLPGLDAIDEAVGRATELGKPILFSLGLGGLNPTTFASMSVLRYVTTTAAKYGLRVIVPIFRPEVYPVVEDLMREAYTVAGRPDLFSSDDIRFFSDQQSTWASAVAGTMERERPAANFFFGEYGFESLIIAETGRHIGAIQIAATVSYYQIPFFILACDYTLMGEELYAASAYLSDNPVLRGSLVGQDLGKILITLLIVLGSIGATFATLKGIPNWILELLKY